MSETMQKITRSALISKMKDLSDVYDVVRIVDANNTSVLIMDESKTIRKELDSCYSVWNKTARCENCISKEACSKHKRMNKFEFKDQESYYVIAIPYMIIDEDNIIVSLELVNKVSDELLLKSNDLNQASDFVKAINNKTYKDSLTNTFNRRYYDEKRFLFDSINSYGSQIGILMVDINHFKNINDTYGHNRGDDMLAKVGELLRRNFRNSDSVIRFGGDEFLVVLKDCNERFLENKIKSIKKAVNGIKFDWLFNEEPSISVGLAYSDSFTGESEQIDCLIEEADREMYKDKMNPGSKSYKKTILLVDDIKEHRSLVKNNLLSKFLVLEAENGNDASVILKSNHVDLIINDMNMNSKQGCDLIIQVRNNPDTKNIPIIVINEDDENIQSKAIACGADLFVANTANSEYLYKSIIKLIGEDHGRSDLFDLNFVLDSIPGAVIISKYNDVIPETLYCSRGIYDLAGIEAKDLSKQIYKVYSDIIYEKDRKKYEECIKKIIDTKSRGELLYRSKKQDGEFIWLWLQARYIGEEEGFPVVEKILLDVSNSTNMYETILDEASSLICVIDESSYEILYCNSKAKEVLNCRVGDSCHKVLFERNDICKECVLYNDLASRNFEYDNRSYYQIFKRIEWNGRHALLECMEDITNQKELQSYIESEKNTLNNIVQKVPAGLFVFKFDDNYNLELISFNPEAIRLMGANSNKASGSGMQEILYYTHPDDTNIIMEVIEKMKTPDSFASYEYRHFNKEKNDYCWLSARARSEKQLDGELYVYISYVDITNSKESQKIKEDLRIAELENKSKTDFMSNMSHDMRTPLNVIIGLAGLMEDIDDINELHYNAAQIVNSGQLLLSLINDTLDMNKIAAGKLSLNLVPVDGQKVLNIILSTVDMLAKENDINMLYDFPTIPEGQWVKVLADPLRLEQVLVNIVSNAIKYSHRYGTVELHMKNILIDDEKVIDEYKVVDYGIGMSEEFLGHLFEPFVQEGRANPSKVGGSGLGMSIVKKIVELMDSKIEVESKIDQGTTVTITLTYPRFFGEEIVEEEPIEINIEGMNVLICEDHPINRKILVDQLTKKGVNCDVAENGKDGCEKFQNNKENTYDAILMDVRMPVMDGITACKTIRHMHKEDSSSIPIIAMTANAFNEDIEETKKAGMNEHLAKPVSTDVLYKTLAKFYNK